MPESSPTTRRPVSDWTFFGVAMALTAGGMAVAMSRSDLGSGAGISRLIAISVRFSVPWLYLAFAASSVAVLVPGALGRWLVRRRRIFGLCYAAGMLWQALFIVWLIGGHTDHYLRASYDPYALLEEIPGYVILAAMVFTSFDWGRRLIGSARWRQLHTVGIYYLWAETWSTYWFELYVYRDVQITDIVYYWTGLIAWGLRITAWYSQQRRRALASPTMVNTSSVWG